ncbi:hypothetical protein HMPREF9621_01273 [Cutibacterium modestum HL037PA2]|nr:hypothetical protein HMPREF9621_01273 [Cutibacterium modestum HL037PA2]
MRLWWDVLILASCDMAAVLARGLVALAGWIHAGQGVNRQA